MKYIYLSFLFILVSNYTQAQNLEVYPVPQQTSITGYMETPVQFTVQQLNSDAATAHLLATHFDESNTSTKGFSIVVGEVSNRFPKKLLKKVPAAKEGYYLYNSGKKISVIGRDARGTYYGLQTLISLLNNSKLPLGEIIDYPDVTARGVVEGFYGTPWSFENRMRQIDFYGANKLNTYIYGPKDDAYHSSPHWRDAYPKEEEAQLKKLIDRAALQHVDFVWAVHPGKDIQWNEQDRTALLQKFEMMYQLGVRAFAVFFDDISGEGTNPTQQAQLLNHLNEKFVQEKEDVLPLIMCPTEYNKSWSNLDGGYLETLGKELDPSIRIMWTGNRVIADIDHETMEWINSKIQRKAFIWWNFPVSDYVRNHLLMGPTYGNEKDIANDLSGFVSNPMEHAEASKIAIFGVADYTWNMESYNSEKTWLKSLQNLMPESYKALEVFARHNSDLGPNGHRYRRKESVNFAPQLQLFQEQLLAHENLSSLDSVQSEFNAMLEASYILLNSKDNEFLLDEMRPWVKQFQFLAQAGLSTINMYEALHAKNTEDFERSHQAVSAINSAMYQLDRTENQNPYQPGVKTATLVVEPFIEKTFSFLTAEYNKEFNKNLETAAHYNPHKIYTNVVRLQDQPLQLRDRTLSLNPPLEVLQIDQGAYFGFELEDTLAVKSVVYKLTPATSLKSLALETSTDAKEWNTLKPEEKDGTMQVQVSEKVKFIRLINTSSEEIEVRIEEFRLQTR